jgi:hypothetical protein
MRVDKKTNVRGSNEEVVINALKAGAIEKYMDYICSLPKEKVSIPIRQPGEKNSYEKMKELIYTAEDGKMILWGKEMAHPVIRYYCNKYNISEEEFFNTKLRKTIVAKREVAFFLRVVKGLPYLMIARLMKRDHTTIIRNVREYIKERCKLWRFVRDVNNPLNLRMSLI